MYLSSSSARIFQNNQNVPPMSTNIIYIPKTTKMAGSVRKVNFAEQEIFIIKAVVTGWETGNPMIKPSVF